jgi:thiosulfate reductase cytochrome b subunit
MNIHPLITRISRWTGAFALTFMILMARVRRSGRRAAAAMRLLAIEAARRAAAAALRILTLIMALISRIRRSRGQAAAQRKMHPVIIRIVHWTNAVAMIILIMSGWKIYEDEALFGFLHFPEQIVLGVWAQHALQWHFAFMWVLMVNGLVYLGYGLFSGRFRRMLWPIRPREVIEEVLKALTFRLQHDDLTHYNAVQKLLYGGVILVIIVQVISGLAIWKPVQFSSLVALFYDFQGARLAHFLGMTAICLFMIVHITLALLVPRTILAMFTGGPRLDRIAASSSSPVPAAPAT